MKKYFGILLFCSLLLTGCNASDVSSSNTDAFSQSVADTAEIPEGAESNIENIPEGLDSEIDTSENTESLVDTHIGVNSLSVNDESLFDSQKMLIGYTDLNYFTLQNYELLQRYPDAFNHSQVAFTGQVKKIINADDTTYEILITLDEWHDNQFFSENEAVIKGNHADNYSDVTKNYRVIEGDMIKCYGVSQGSQTVEINGESSYIPVFNANQVIVDNGMGTFTRYNSGYIKELANIMFPNGIKIREPIEGQDFNIGGSWDGIHDYSRMFLIGEPDNQSNANFTRYEFYQSVGYIRDNKSTSDIIRQLNMSLDMEHYLLTVYDSALKSFTIEYYDLSYNKLWSREFENSTIYEFSTMNDNKFFDYTDSAIYLDLNNNLYIIDLESGEDKISPVTVGEKTDIRKTSDSILLFSDSKVDTVIKTDLEGNILWKLDLPLYNDELKNSYTSMGADFHAKITAIQFDEENIKIEYRFYADTYNWEYNFTDVLWSETKIFVVSKDGTMLMNTEIL